MAKKLSTAMLTALAIAHSQGEVLIGDDQRIALLGMAGRVSSNTITALREAGLLAYSRDMLSFELTKAGLSALGHAGVITPEQYTTARQAQRDAVDAAHTEALTLRGQYAGTPARFNPEVIDELHAFALTMRAEFEERMRPVVTVPAEAAPVEPRKLFIRRTRRGSETVTVERVHAGRVDYRVLDTKSGRVSAPYRMRQATFEASYTRVPA